MPKRITVPEPDEKEYTKEALRRIRLKHEAAYGKLPYPNPVPELPLRNTSPSTLDMLWLNKWNIFRHFIIGGGVATLAMLTKSHDLVTLAGAFVVGGLTDATRKGFKDKRAMEGKPSLFSVAKSKLTHRPLTRGDGMGIRNEVYEVKVELVKVGDILMDDVPNSQQFSEGMAAVLGIIKEGSDFRSIPKQERAKAIGHAFVMAGAEIYDKGVTYSDEV